MKRWIFAVILLWPVVAGSGDYGRVNEPTYIIENRGGVISVLPQRPMLTRIYKFARRKYNINHHLAMEFGQACVATPDPRSCAAIAGRESNFTPWAVGKDFERSAWQILDPPADLNPLDNREASRIAMLLLKEKIKGAGGNLRQGIARYNGAGPKAQRYADAVMKLRSQI